MAKYGHSFVANLYNWRLVKKNLLLIAIVLLVLYLFESFGIARDLFDYGGKRGRYVNVKEQIKLEVRSAIDNSRNADRVSLLRKMSDSKDDEVKFFKQYDAQCDKLDEWVQLTERVYFKRSFAFYFVDKGIYRTFFVASSNDFQLRLVLLLDIEILDKLSGQVKQVIKHNVTNVVINPPWFVNEYGLINMDAWFNLTEIFETSKLNVLTEKFRVNMRIHDQVSQRTTVKPIEIKVKFYQVSETVKKTSMLCSKCYYLDGGDLKHMHWWFELNKQFGYHKLVICNNSIETPRFGELVKEYEGFVEVTQMKCLPNFLGPTKGGYQRKYLRHYTEIKHDGEYVALMSDVFSGLAINECLLNYTDQYNFINVDDYDDTIIPRKYKLRKLGQVIDYISSLSESDMLTPGSKIINDECGFVNQTEMPKSTELELYLRHLVTEHKYQEPTSFYFGQGFYMKHHTMNKIFNQLDKYLKSPVFKTNQAMNKDHLVTVVDLDPAVDNSHFPYNYTFVIKNDPGEIQYIRNLIQINAKVIKPFLNQNADAIKAHCDRYDRFYMISGSVNDFAWGKTIHNTKTTFEITLHHSYRSLWQSNRPYQATYASVPYDSGHLSHFRNMIRLPLEAIISIKQLHLDLNFLNCYFRPLLERMKS